MKLTPQLRALAGRLIYPHLKIKTNQDCINIDSKPCKRTHVTIESQCTECYILSLRTMEREMKTTRYAMACELGAYDQSPEFEYLAWDFLDLQARMLRDVEARLDWA